MLKLLNKTLTIDSMNNLPLYILYTHNHLPMRVMTESIYTPMFISHLIYYSMNFVYNTLNGLVMGGAIVMSVATPM
jgi:hypothetical protein